MEKSVTFSSKGCDFKLRLSITDLPSHIFVDILLQVPVENIIFCKCVCKAWYKIISDRQFIKLYFARADVYPLVRTLKRAHVSRTLYFVDPMYYMFDSSTEMSLGTKFKIPLYNSEKLFESETQAKLTQNDGGIKRKRCLKWRPDDHKFNIVNSCKGFLCLLKEHNVVVCNPITGEYVKLPPEKNARYFGLGLGFSPNSNNFKVIRMNDWGTGDWWTNLQTSKPIYATSRNAQIHILGTQLWEDIGLAPNPNQLECPIFLNRTLSWLYIERDRPSFIVFFDFDNHQFGTFSLPPGVPRVVTILRTRIGVLRNRLCYCYCTKDEILHIWVMSEYGVEETWSNICSVCLRGDQAIRRNGGFYQPINQLENGAILLFHKKFTKQIGLLYYYEPETHILKSFRFGGVSARFEAIGFTPSFTLLKDVLVGNEVEVFNVKSRCAELKMPEENITPSLVQQTSVDEQLPNQS